MAPQQWASQVAMDVVQDNVHNGMVQEMLVVAMALVMVIVRDF